MLALVDDVDPSVLSSRADLKLQKRFVPFIGTTESVELRYASPIAEPSDEKTVIRSTPFFVDGNRVEIRNKLDSYKLQLHATSTDTVLVDNIGEYAPSTGIINLVGIRVDSIIGGNNYIKITADAANMSVSSPGQNQIVVFDDAPSFVQAQIVTTS